MVWFGGASYSAIPEVSNFTFQGCLEVGRSCTLCTMRRQAAENVSVRWARKRGEPACCSSQKSGQRSRMVRLDTRHEQRSQRLVNRVSRWRMTVITLCSFCSLVRGSDRETGGRRGSRASMTSKPEERRHYVTKQMHAA